MQGWYICDRERVYIHRAWGSEEEAYREMAILLRRYPEGHEWRKRLNVRLTDPPPLPTKKPRKELHDEPQIVGHDEHQDMGSSPRTSENPL